MGTSASTRISIPPSFLPDDPEWKRAVGRWMLEANQGHLANTGNVTLAVLSATTTVADARVGVNSYIDFMPTTLNAAAELTALYVSSRGKGTFTITHTNSVVADRTYVYGILG